LTPRPGDAAGRVTMAVASSWPEGDTAFKRERALWWRQSLTVETP
jgi:hypothetical protein